MHLFTFWTLIISRFDRAWLSRIWKFETGKAWQISRLVFLQCWQTEMEQECIPVGCILPTHYCTGGYPWQRPPMDRDPLYRDPRTETTPGHRPFQAETPQAEIPLDRDPPGQRETPWDRDPPSRDRDRDMPCGQTDTCENITFANFVCGW